MGQPKLKQMSRREALKTMLRSGGGGVLALQSRPLQMLLGTMMNGIAFNALASGPTNKKFIYLQQPGGPPRWTFDYFAAPFQRGDFAPNLDMGTRYTDVGGRYTGTEYATVFLNGMHLPWMWQFSVPRAGGGTRPMTDLLAHMLQIRGIDCGQPDHSGAAIVKFQPLGAARSLGAVPADHGSYPIPALDLGGQGIRFSSLTGVSPLSIGMYGNLISNLLTPFKEEGSTNYKNMKSQVQTFIDRAISAIESDSAFHHPKANELTRSLNSAKELVVFASGDLNGQWTQLRNKYVDLVSRSFDPNVILPGINDKPIGTLPAADRDTQYSLLGIDYTVRNDDLRTLIQPNCTVFNLAETMAMTEYVVKNDLSNFISGLFFTIQNVNLNGDPFGFSHDEHFAGYMPSLLLNTMMNRALSACMIELIDSLKAAGKFNDTVLEINGEFSRNPRGDGKGSDHGSDGCSVALFSGGVQGPKVIGDVTVNGYGVGNAYHGTWGKGVPMVQLGNEQIGMGHYASTICAMMGLPSPVTLAESLITRLPNGVIVPNLPNGRQV
jgi:hypothetical protein